MGNTLAGNAITPMVESFIDILQDKGLSQLASRRFGLHKWGSKSTFGYDFSRNPAFNTLVSQLITPYREGILASGIKIMDIDTHMEKYINIYLVHHVMQCLLTPETEKPQPVYAGLVEAGLFQTPLLPQYNATTIAQFQALWTTLPSGRKIAIGTPFAAEQALLSAKLAVTVTELISKIDVKGFVTETLLTYQANKRQEAMERYSLFAETAQSNALESTHGTCSDEEDHTAEAKEELSASVRWAMNSDIL